MRAVEVLIALSYGIGGDEHGIDAHLKPADCLDYPVAALCPRPRSVYLLASCVSIPSKNTFEARRLPQSHSMMEYVRACHVGFSPPPMLARQVGAL
jgi:hypothetical protein